MEGTFRSIRDADDLRQAARLLAGGDVVGSYIRGVCGLWIDGASARAIERIDEIKGELREGRPLGTTLEGPAFVNRIDPDGIAPSAHGLLLDADRLQSRLGSLCFIRVP